jgi:hypothetical protein
MENMLPENSFPQICVVSISECLRIVEIRQEYKGSVVICAACLLPATRARYKAQGTILQLQIGNSGGSRGIQPPERVRNSMAFRPGPLSLFWQRPKAQL